MFVRQYQKPLLMKNKRKTKKIAKKEKMCIILKTLSLNLFVKLKLNVPKLSDGQNLRATFDGFTI